MKKGNCALESLGGETSSSCLPHRRILIVDDEESIRVVLEQVLQKNGNTCRCAATALEARGHLERESFDVVLCDIRMPGESGIDFAEYLVNKHPETSLIMMTGLDDPQFAKTLLALGACGYIIKPFTMGEVLINVSNAFHRRTLEIQNKLRNGAQEKTGADKTGEIERTNNALVKTMKGVIQSIALAIESRDPYTAVHQKRVSFLAAAIAREMGLSRDRQEGIQMAGLIHDLGKIAVPAEILSKPCRLTALEYEIIKLHPQVGYNILKDINFPWLIPEMVYQHHERINGSGYPQGLMEDQIMLEAKILGVADVMEAMASHRPYRPALGLDKAFEEVGGNQGLLYDVEVVDACEKLWKSGECGLEEPPGRPLARAGDPNPAFGGISR